MGPAVKFLSVEVFETWLKGNKIKTMMVFHGGRCYLPFSLKWSWWRIWRAFWCVSLRFWIHYLGPQSDLHTCLMTALQECRQPLDELEVTLAPALRYGRSGGDSRRTTSSASQVLTLILSTYLKAISICFKSRYWEAACTLAIYTSVRDKTACTQILHQFLTSCVTLGKLLYLSVPQFPL